MRDGADRSCRLPIVPLLVERDADSLLLPNETLVLQAGDRLLFASTLAARRDLELSLNNANELDFVLNGHENSGSLLGRLLATG